MRRGRGLSKLLEKYPILYSLFILGGIWIIYRAIKKPSSYWESERIVFRRKVWGDKLVAFFDLMIGIFVITVGSFLLRNAYLIRY